LLVVCRLLAVCWLLAVELLLAIALSIVLGVRLLLSASRLDVLLIHLLRGVARCLGHGKAHLVSGWVLRGWSCLNAAHPVAWLRAPGRNSPSTVLGLLHLLRLLRLLHRVRALCRTRCIGGR